MERIRPVRRGRPCNTSGSQLWQGGIAIFSAIAIRSKVRGRGVRGEEGSQELIVAACKSPPKRRRAEARA